MAGSLALSGLVLIGIAIFEWQHSPADTTTAKETTITASASSVRVAIQGEELPGTISESIKESTTETTTRHSDTVTVAVLTLGGLLLFSGAFFPRVQKLGFGGASMEVSQLPLKDLTKFVVASLQEREVSDLPEAVARAVVYGLQYIRDDIRRGMVKPGRGLRRPFAVRGTTPNKYLEEIAQVAAFRAATELSTQEGPPEPPESAAPS